MSDPEAVDPAFRERIRNSFARQGAMRLIGARLDVIEPGRVEISLPYRLDLTQQHGYIHAGIITAIADTACGYAALSLLPPDREVLSVEFKINLLRPAAGENFVARASVIRSGRTLSVARADVFAETSNEPVMIAAMQATIFAAAATERGL